ncbi:iron uptake protein [Isoalcanivorax beigongshangi]|uniref:Iron uptake protein n=1 Tax=Isoalcanivorax beigongshangi TaxID=3238810 RepID=A0ABV4AHV2_9GAMM
MSRFVASLPLLSRSGAAVLGGYAFCWGLIAFGVAAGFTLGMPFHDAERLFSLLALMLYPLLFLWSFSTRHGARLWALLLGGAALMSALASLLQQRLL